MIASLSPTLSAAIAADPEYAEAYSNVGLVYLMKAQDYASAYSGSAAIAFL